MPDGRKSSGIVRGFHPGPPLILEVELPAGGAFRLELPHQADPACLQDLERELLNQTVEFQLSGSEATVWYFRPVTEDDEVEYVYRVCLNAELSRRKA